MAKLRIVGSAEQEFEYDLMKIQVTFKSFGRSSEEVLGKVLDQCEEFLSLLNGWNIPKGSIRIGRDEVIQHATDNRSQELDVCAIREIAIKLPFDISLSNSLMELIKEQKNEVDISVSPAYSKNKEIDQELIHKAFEDSKSKAEAIATATRLHLAGIDSVIIGNARVSEETSSEST